MTRQQLEAHERMLATLPVRTHQRVERRYQHVNIWTGKPIRPHGRKRGRAICVKR